MRIALVNTSRDQTEATDYVFGLAKALSVAGHKVTLYSSRRMTFEENDLEVEFKSWTDSSNEIAFSGWLHESLVEENYDVVEAPQVGFPLLIEQLAGGTPTVVRRESSIMDSVISGQFTASERSSFSRFGSLRAKVWSHFMLEEKSMILANRILVPDGFAVGNVPPDCHGIVHIVPPGIESVIEREFNPEGTINVLLEGFKDTFNLRRTLRSIAESIDEPVVALGEPVASDDWDKFIENIGMVNHGVSSYPTEKWLEVFEKAKLIVFPGEGYGFKYRMLQAFSRGCPVLVFQWEGIDHSWPVWRAGPVSREAFKNFERIVRGCETIYGKDRLKFLDFSKEFLWDRLISRYEEAYSRAMGASIASRIRG